VALGETLRFDGQSIIDAVLAALGCINVLVNNVGIVNLDPYSTTLVHGVCGTGWTSSLISGVDVADLHSRACLACPVKQDLRCLDVSFQPLMLTWRNDHFLFESSNNLWHKK